MLLLALFALSVGWCVDRSVNLHPKIRQNERSWIGYARYTECLETILSAEACFDLGPDDSSSYLEFELYRCVSTAWREEQAIDRAENVKMSSTEIAYEAMILLNCNSHAEFIGFASQTRLSVGKSVFSEIFDPESEEYRSLEEFVVRSLKLHGDADNIHL